MDLIGSAALGQIPDGPAILLIPDGPAVGTAIAALIVVVAPENICSSYQPRISILFPALG